MANMVTITEARFVELYRKATETESICHECKDEHTAEEFSALKKERDELKAKLEQLYPQPKPRLQSAYSALLKKRDALNKQLAAAERCIDSISRVDDLPYTVHSIVDNYRNFEEAQ